MTDQECRTLLLLIILIITSKEVTAWYLVRNKIWNRPLQLIAKKSESWLSSSTTRLSSSTKADLSDQYRRARDIRTLHGHQKALPLYQQLLKWNPDDRTAGTRIAASPETPWRHDKACGGDDDDDDDKHILSARKTQIKCLQKMLKESNYDHGHVSEFLGVHEPESCQFSSCEGPLFASPVPPGSVCTSNNYPLSLSSDKMRSSLECLISLFLLSLAVPKDFLVGTLGEQNCKWMQEFGWIYPCSVDPSLMIPYVHVLPLTFNVIVNDTVIRNHQQGRTLYMVTDLHPRVLSTVSVGSEQEHAGNSVMYIGPDSLALAQHFAPYHYLLSTTNESTIYGLDLGTGSGVQALTALTYWNLLSENTYSRPVPPLHFLAVDVNPRALKFTQFNAILNGLDDQLTLMEADLITGTCHNASSDLEDLLQVHTYSLILANPPFLPVPGTEMLNKDIETDLASDATMTSADSISRRYGLFSSGGLSGETILQRVIKIASRYMRPGGILGIVSEFFFQSDDLKFDRFCKWWESSSNSSGIGILFVNEFPIDSVTYATRRSDTPEERGRWRSHLQSLDIDSASPGMLYIQKSEAPNCTHATKLNLTISYVPKTSLGSVWTPSNVHAIQFTQQKTCEFYGW